MIASPNNKKLDKPDKNKGYHSHFKPDPKNLYSTSLPRLHRHLRQISDATACAAEFSLSLHLRIILRIIPCRIDERTPLWNETRRGKEGRERKKGNAKEEKARIFPSNVFHEQFLSTPTRRHHDAHLPRNSRSPPIVHRGNYYSHFCDACSRSSFAGWRKITSSPRNHREKVASVQRGAWREGRKKGKKGKKTSLCLVGHAKIAAKLPFSLWKLYARVCEILVEE